MQTLRLAAIAPALVLGALVLGSPVLAQSTEAPTSSQAQAQGAAWYEKLFAPDLIGKPVRTASGDELAKVEEVAKDPASGDLVAVLKSGGFLGFGGKHKVVPLREIQKQDSGFVLPQGSKEKLSGRPDFDDGKYPPVTHFSMLGTVAK